MKTSESIRSRHSVQDQAKTGWDRSAGRATRAAALIFTAILLPWAVFRRDLRWVVGWLRQPVSALGGAARRFGGVLTGAGRRAGAALTTLARGPIAALIATGRGFLRRRSRVLRALLRGGSVALSWAMSILTTVGRTPIRVLVRVFMKARTFLSIVSILSRLMLIPFRLGGASSRPPGTGARTKSGGSPAAAGAGHAYHWEAVGPGSFRQRPAGFPGRAHLLAGGPPAATEGAEARLARYGGVVSAARQWLIAIRRPVVRLISFGLHGLVRVVAAGSRYLAGFGIAWQHRIERIAVAWAGMTRRSADGARVAAGIDPDVAHYTGQAELAAAIQSGLQAKRQGDLDRATLRLGRAVQLAAASTHTDLLSLLTKVVDVLDGDAGTVTLRRKVEAGDEMALDSGSTRTVPAAANPVAPLVTPAGMAPHA